MTFTLVVFPRHGGWGYTPCLVVFGVSGTRHTEGRVTPTPGPVPVARSPHSVRERHGPSSRSLIPTGFSLPDYPSSWAVLSGTERPPPLTFENVNKERKLGHSSLVGLSSRSRSLEPSKTSSSVFGVSVPLDLNRGIVSLGTRTFSSGRWSERYLVRLSAHPLDPFA